MSKALPFTQTAADDTPITLAEACDAVFRGSMTVATLRAEAARGRLTIFKIGRRQYTTLRDVREMIEQCRVERKAPVSISTRGGDNGSSETARISSVRAALRMKADELKSTSRTTSTARTSLRRALPR